MKKMWVIWVLTFVGCLIGDQYSKKHYETKHLKWSDPEFVLGYRADRMPIWLLGVGPSAGAQARQDSWIEVNSTYARNPGAAWSRGRSMNTLVKNIIFLTVTLVAIGLCIFFIRTYPIFPVFQGTALLLSGALGNQLDRILRGYVIDWLHVHWRIVGHEVSFPVFNLADVFVCTGIPLISMAVISTNARNI